MIELLILGGREDRGGHVVLAVFRHPVLGLGGSRFGKESRYDMTDSGRARKRLGLVRRVRERWEPGGEERRR